LYKKLRRAKEGSVLYLEGDSPNYMQAWFYPIENPYYDIVGSKGTYSIDQVPAGNYKILVWHPILGVQEKKINVGTTGKITVNFEFSNR